MALTINMFGVRLCSLSSHGRFVEDSGTLVVFLAKLDGEPVNCYLNALIYDITLVPACLVGFVRFFIRARRLNGGFIRLFGQCLWKKMVM